MQDKVATKVRATSTATMVEQLNNRGTLEPIRDPIRYIEQPRQSIACKVTVVETQGLYLYTRLNNRGTLEPIRDPIRYIEQPRQSIACKVTVVETQGLYLYTRYL